MQESQSINSPLRAFNAEPVLTKLDVNRNLTALILNNCSKEMRRAFKQKAEGI